jgi:large subunit ribosomal protein L17e
LRAHFKNTFETGRALKGLKLKKAIRYIEDVIEHKQCIPFRKHTGCIGSTAQAKVFGQSQGRWPDKPARYILQLLKNL